MVYVHLHVVDHDVSLRDAAAATLDDANWSPAEWHRAHRGKIALRRSVKKIRQQLKECEAYRLFVSKNHLSGWNDVMVIDKMIVDKGLFHEALEWDLWEVMHLCVGKRPAQTAPGITSRSLLNCHRC